MPFSADKNPLSTSMSYIPYIKRMSEHAYLFITMGHENRYDKQQWNHDHSKYLRLMVINWNGTTLYCHWNQILSENAYWIYDDEIYRFQTTKMKKLLVHTIFFTRTLLLVANSLLLFLLFIYHSIWCLLLCMRCAPMLTVIICLFDYIGTGFTCIYWSLTHKIKYKRIYSVYSCIYPFLQIGYSPTKIPRSFCDSNWIFLVRFISSCVFFYSLLSQIRNDHLAKMFNYQ